MGALNLPQIAENQAAAYVTSNDADAGLEKALCDSKLDHDASGGDITLTETYFKENWFHRLIGTPAAAFNVIVPPVKRPFMIHNSSGQSATIKTAAGAAGQVLGGETRLFYCDGTDINSLTDVSSTGAAVSVFSGAMVSLTGNVSVPNSVNTAINWAAESYDTDGFFDGTSYPSRFTVPSGVSKVILSAEVRWDSDVSGNRDILIYKNGNGSYPGRAFLTAAAATTLLMNLGSPPLNVTPGDYFELIAWQGSGSARQVQDNYATWFAIQAVG